MPARAAAAAAALSLLALGCPEQKKPDRGLELQYRKPDRSEIRTVVEKRLAALKVKARIDEDGDTLRLRLPEGTDPAPVKRMLALGAKFELCGELPEDGKRWCETRPPEGVAREKDQAPGEGCYFVGKDAAAVRHAGEQGISGRVVLQPVDEGVRTYAVPQTCLSPGIAEATVRQAEGFSHPVVHLRFDRHGGEQFEALTTRLVHQRLLILLDGEVKIAPVVMEPIRGGAAQLTTGSAQADEAVALAAALQGGELPRLVLEVERTYGPPSLTR